MVPSDPQDPADESLVAAARDGDASAFERLLRRHEGRALRLLRLLGVPEADREDVAQEIFVRVFRHLGGFRAGKPFGAWLYRITVNSAHDYRRRMARQSREGSWMDDLDGAPDRGPGPAELLDRQDGLRGLEAALGRLSERERTVFVLCEMEELDTRQVARALGITRITVRRHLSRARGRLRDVLEEARKEPDAVERSRPRGSSTPMRRTGG